MHSTRQEVLKARNQAPTGQARHLEWSGLPARTPTSRQRPSTSCDSPTKPPNTRPPGAGTSCLTWRPFHPFLGVPPQACLPCRGLLGPSLWGPGQLSPPSTACFPGRRLTERDRHGSVRARRVLLTAEWGARHRPPAAMGTEHTRKAGRAPALSGPLLPQNRASLQLRSQLEVSCCLQHGGPDTRLNVK